MYDDEDVSPVGEEEILKLSGGGDWHTAYVSPIFISNFLWKFSNIDILKVLFYGPRKLEAKYLNQATSTSVVSTESASIMETSK